MTKRATPLQLFSLLFFTLLFSFETIAQCGNLYISAVVDGPLSGGTPKGVQFCATGAIADLSIYGFGSANNGGGTDGEEFTFPADALSAGQCIWVATEEPNFTAYFGFAPDYTDGSAPNINGDDAVELFCMGTLEDLFGDINTDGTGACWDHVDGYAINNTMMPNFGAFDCADYTFSGPDALDGTMTVNDIPGGNPFPTGGGGATCSITNVAAGTASCNDNNAEFEVTFTVTDGSGTYNVVAASADYGFAIGDVITSGASSPIMVSITGPTTAGTIDINVEDDADNTCTGTAVSVSIPDCPSIVPTPTLAATGTNPSACSATDGSIALTTTNVPDGAYTINYDGGSFTNVLITSNMGTIMNVAEGVYNNLTITVSGNTSTEDVDITLTAPNSISNIVATPVCNADGTYNVDITFDATNPVNTEYTIDINGISFGPFPFDAGTAQSATGLTDVSFIGDEETGISVTVTDGNTGGGGSFGPIFISEIHYDNFGTDEGESIEVTAVAGTDLTGYSLVLYNGNGGTAYNTIDLTPAGVVADAGNGCGAVSFDASGIQNGDPDGIALVDNSGTVIEFISYEGTFMATDGPANGMMSTDIGVSEPGEIGESVQLTDAGWTGPMGVAASPNTVNTGLSCPTGAPAVTCDDSTTFDELLCPVIVCGISNVTATTICNPFGGFDLELCFEYENPLGANVVVQANGQTIGTYPYPAASGDCIQVQNIESNPSEWGCGTQGMVEIEVFDENTPFEGIPFISEFHYDNGGTDENEFIEVTAGAGVALSAYQIELYNGNGGVVYNTIPLSGTVTDQGNGCGALSFAANGIQNGPDGMALVEIATGMVLDFISYEGVVEATDGSAAGMISTDVLVEENAATTADQSIELSDAGWAVAETNSAGMLNAGILSCLTPTCVGNTNVPEPDCCPAPIEECGFCTYYVYLYDAVGNGWDASRLLVNVNQGETVEYKMTPADGLSVYYPIYINDGGTIDLMFMNGANATEQSYQLFDTEGNVVFEDGVPFTGASPVAGVTNSFKAECPECCQEEDTFTIGVFMGSTPEAMSWEVTDGFGERVAFVNAGDYLGFAPGALVTQEVVLEGCNDYRFTAFSALNNGWQGGSWQIVSSDPTRGELITSGAFSNLFLIAEGPCMFGEETTSLFTLPCHTDCPADETVVADDIANCAITTYTAPTIDPFICSPNSCHGNDVSVNVQYLTAVGGVVVGPQGTTSAALPVGENPVVFETTYADGQIVRCTMSVFVLADANPNLTCNDNVLISLHPALTGTDECEVTVTPDMVLEDTGACEAQYVVTVFDANGNSLGNTVGPDQAGQTFDYTVQHIGATGNLCWGTLTVEDKFAPVVACQDYTVACNHPNVLDEFYMHTEIFNADPNELPANIAGGTSTAPSETSIILPGECTPLGEVIQDINVNIAITHNDVEDLQILLVAPNGDTLILMDYQTCNNLGVANIEVSFDDESGDIINNGCTFNFPGIGGQYRPVERLSDWYGLPYTDFMGDWEILVYDNDATLNESIGYGRVDFAQIELKAGFPTPFAAVDCTLDAINLIEEEFIESNCDQSEWVGASVVRTWQAIDAFGNSTNCTQTVNLQAPTFDMLTLPGDVQLECGEVPDEPGLDLTGTPYYDCFDLTDDLHGLCDISYTYEDNVVPTCGLGKKIIRTWTIINWCSGVNRTHEQTIKIEDTVGPTINVDAVTMISDEYSCLTSVTFDGAITDACSDIQQVVVEYVEGGGVYNQSGTLIIVDITDGGSIDNLPLGMTEVLIRAKDNCGNDSVEEVAIDVEDTRAPIAICDDELHVSLGSDGTARLTAENVDEGSYDNCTDVTLQVRRTSGCLSSSVWRDYVEFACCDVDELITVELLVTDEAGNTNTCWKEVLVEDALPPVLTCPADKTLNCDDPNVHDPFDEAEAIDNCTVTVTHVDGGELDQCRAGVLTRTFTASDDSEKSVDVTCVQRITVEHISDFVVQFPADVTISTCPDDLTATGEPQISDDDCELLAINHDDLLLTIVDDACYKIERTWTIVNWCIYEEGAAATDLGTPQPLPRTYRDDDGYFQWTQIIKVLDNDAPVIDCPADQTFCDLTDGCEGEAQLTITAEDECSAMEALEYTYKIDAFNDGTFDIEDTGSDATGVYPYGTHRIKWIVEDGCGNTSSCEYLFTIEDCKNPTPVCLNGISIENMQTGCVDVWAEDLLEYAFDNCSDDAFVENSVRIRREGEVTSPQSILTLCCEDVGTTVIVEIWVEDEAGNADYCTTYIIVQDNLNNCDDDGGDDSRTIAGRLTTETGTPIDQATVHLTGDATASTEVDASGNYGFANLDPSGTYHIHAEKDIDPLNGVSTYDLVLMSQHILGISRLDSPYKMIAADVNNDGNITTFDVVQTRQLILFVINDFPSNTSWRFIDKNYQFPNPENPWLEAFPEVVDYQNLAQDQLTVNFTGVKIGDVNGDTAANNFSNTNERNTMGTLPFVVKDEIVQVGAEKVIEFRASDFQNINGYQFTLQFDAAALRLEGVEAGVLDVSEANVGMRMLSEGALTMSWSSSEAISVADDAVLFGLRFTAQKEVATKDAFQLNSRYTGAEAYQGTSLMDVALTFDTDNGMAAQNNFALYQNAPNPFTGETVIAFDLPEADQATLKVMDVSGKVLKIVEGTFAKGYNQIRLNSKDLQAVGVLYYQLDTPTHSATRKMIVIE